MPISKYNVRKKYEKNIYCSKECYLSKIRICNKICQGCNTSFLPKDNRVRFCSKKCYQNYAKRNKIRKKTGFWLENGYKVLYNNGHPIKEHIFIMEQHIHRKTHRGEVVHHIDGNKLNNNINNLMLLTAGEHSKLHRKQDLQNGKKLFVKTSI